MDNKHENEGFSYTYSAKEQAELQNIRKKYAPPEEDKMEHLRRLDRGVYSKASSSALAVGIIGSLLLGIGMCCAMVWKGWAFIPGIVIGLIGIGILAFAYPIYNRVLKKEREKIAPEVLRLTDELMK